ncbi:MAG TPA: hypothetical protein VLE43_03005 [Candidatus Saccharimonadia bacterium]|nr:hypothetical protein [Candidatus Saccharimonadia bacterium]
MKTMFQIFMLLASSMLTISCQTDGVVWESSDGKVYSAAAFEKRVGHSPAIDRELLAISDRHQEHSLAMGRRVKRYDWATRDGRQHYLALAYNPQTGAWHGPNPASGFYTAPEDQRFFRFFN